MSNKNESRLLIGLLLIAFILLILFWKADLISSIDKLSLWLYPDSIDRRGMTLDLILKIIGGLAILIGLKLALDRAQASLKSADAAKISAETQTEALKSQNQQIELSRNTQLNEIFKNAVDHIGSSNPTVVLAGVHELNFIALKFPNEYSEVVLTVFLSKLRKELYVRNIDEENRVLCQGILNIIFKNSIYNSFQKDLSNCNISEFDLTDFYFENTNLTNSKISKKNKGCIFNKVNFSDINLKDLEFSYCNFAKCNFSSTVFQNICFDNCEFSDAFEWIPVKFNHCEFNVCKFTGFLEEITFFDSQISNTDFNYSYFDHVEFLCVVFQEVTFNKASIKNSTFVAVSFTDTKFSGEVLNSYFAGISKDIISFSSMDIFEKIKINDFSGINFQDLKLNNEIENFNNSHYDNLTLQLKNKEKNSDLPF